MTEIQAAENRSTHLVLPMEGVRAGDLLSDLLGIIDEHGENEVITYEIEKPEKLVFESIGVAIDRNVRTIEGPQGSLHPTNIEFGILELLASNHGTVHSRDRIISEVWGDPFFGDKHVVNVHIGNIRRKLGRQAGIDRRVIQTIPRLGFLFQSSLEDQTEEG